MREFVLSDGSVNSYGFRIDMGKLHLERFKNNPVMLYNHGELVGKWTGIREEGGKLIATPEFMDGEGEDLAAKVKKRVEQGFVKGASLGIHILAVTHYEDGKPPLVEAEVLETSVCDIPSNANALTLYDDDGNKLDADAVHLALKPTSAKQTKTPEMKFSKETLKALNLPQGAEQADIENAIAQLAADNKVLSDKLEAESANRAASLVDGAIAEGRITANKKEAFLQLAKDNYDLCKTTLESIPGRKALAGKEKRGGESADGDRSEWTFEDWRKKDTPGLLDIKADDPDQYARILTRK